MTTRSHGCPFLQNRKQCTNKHNGKYCNYSNAEVCQHYNEWLKLKKKKQAPLKDTTTDTPETQPKKRKWFWGGNV